MKKILSLFVILSMVFVAAQALADPLVLPDCVPTGDCAWDDPYCITDIPTSATITGSGGSGTGGGDGNGCPIIKCKWEYDLDVVMDLDPICGGLCLDCHDGLYWYHDACCDIDALRVKPILFGKVRVGYYAVVTDPEGVDHVDHVYADIWHPDGTFKYQIELFPVGFEDTVYDKTVALDEWDHAWGCHEDLIKINEVWASGLTGFIPGTEDPMTPEWDIRDEINQEEAYLYYGEALIDYCQPGGWYYVGVRAHDGYDAWCEYLYNRFWYIPTAGIEVDFSSIDYGTVAECSNKWVGGDLTMDTPLKPTVRNIGNTPVELYVWQDSMDFGKTNGAWNVEYDVRLTADGEIRVYSPEEKDLIDPLPYPDDPENEGNFYPGVRIPGVLPLCTEDKLDFSIHVFKGYPGELYTGFMDLCALINIESYIWDTPSVYQDNAPVGVPDIYEGPASPGPDDICP
jgi:hypothetical protein